MARLRLYTRRSLARFSPISSGPAPVFYGASYINGGNPATSTTASLQVIDKLSFLDESISTLAATLITSRRLHASTANSGVAGYAAGGMLTGSTTRTNTVDKINFSNDSVSEVSNMSTGYFAQCGASNHGISGYFFGGQTSTRPNAAEKINYSNDSMSALSSIFIATARVGSAATSNPGLCAFIAGGLNSGGTTLNTIDKVVYSTDTPATYSQTLTNAASSLSGCENNQVAGYTMGGFQNPTYRDQSHKILYSTESISNLPVSITVFQNAGASARYGVAGYWAGGQSTSPTRLNIIQKIDFSNDTKSNLASTLSIARYTAACANNGTL